jgi:Sulfite exporter TauE/SafE
MDESVLNIAIFLAATFAAALVTGLAGFAFGLVAAAVWLHVLSPLQTATLIIAFGLVVQDVSVWKLRDALHWSRLWSFLVGAALGVPLAVAVLGWARPDHVRVVVGIFFLLILFSTYNLARPAIKPFTAGGALADAGVGFANSILGSLTGLRWYSDHHPVWLARLTERSAARRFSADRRRDFCDERPMAGRQRSAFTGYCLVVRDRLARGSARHLGWLEVVRASQRSRIPQDRAAVIARVRRHAALLKPWRSSLHA